MEYPGLLVFFKSFTVEQLHPTGSWLLIPKEAIQDTPLYHSLLEISIDYRFLNTDGLSPHVYSELVSTVSTYFLNRGYNLTRSFIQFHNCIEYVSVINSIGEDFSVLYKDLGYIHKGMYLQPFLDFLDNGNRLFKPFDLNEV